MNVSARHAFWSPARPMLTNRLRTIPFSLGRQYVGFNNPFMGDNNTLNRLENLSISAIQNRILVAPAVVKFQDAAVIAKKNHDDSRGRRYSFNSGDEDPYAPFLLKELPTLTDDEKTVLTLISLNPTPEELSDLVIIDGFFAGSAEEQYSRQIAPTFTQQVCGAFKEKREINPLFFKPDYQGRRGFGAITPTAATAIVGWLTYVPEPGRGPWGRNQNKPNATADEVDAIKNSNFFCEAPAAWPFPNDIRLNWPSWFGIDQNQAWGNIKLQVKNAITIMNAMASYPFPPPIDQNVFQFWVTAAADMQSMVKIGAPLDPAAVDYWITLSVMANYSGMVDRIQADFKKKSKKAKRKAMMALVGLAIASIVAAFLLPGIIAAAVSVIKTAVQTYIDIEKRKKAAKEMADTAKLFEKDAPAFAAKVTEAGKIMDEAELVQQASAPLSPDMHAAVTEVDAETPSSIHPLIPIGGIAAAGLAAFLIFK